MRTAVKTVNHQEPCRDARLLGDASQEIRHLSEGQGSEGQGRGDAPNSGFAGYEIPKSPRQRAGFSPARKPRAFAPSRIPAIRPRTGTAASGFAVQIGAIAFIARPVSIA